MAAISPEAWYRNCVPKSVIGRDDSFQRRLDHLHRRSRQHIELEAIPGDALIENTLQEVDVLFQPNPFSDFAQVLGTNPVVKLRIVQQQVGEFASLLHQVQKRAMPSALRSNSLVGMPRSSLKT